MNNDQKEVLKSQLNSERHTIKELQEIYQQALADCNEKIRALSARSDMEELQSIIYQRQYQESLKNQIEAVLDTLHSNEFESISKYLQTCYQDGFLGTMYDIHGQGIPIIMPMNQNAVVAAIQTDSKLSTNLYTKLGEDVNDLKKTIRSELSRGIANGSTWNQIASDIAGSMKNSPIKKALNNAIRIARTEGHRVQIQSALDAQHEAKEAGADIVKQWDSTLDGKTRDTHRQLDGQIREIDEDFEVEGKKAQAPGMFGYPEEDINCRCALLQRAKWALDQSELDTLKARAEYFELDKSKDFDDFKEKYMNSVENLQKSDKVFTGARIIDPYSDEAVEFAEMYYKEIRSFSTDCKKIAENTGYSEEEIKSIKDYLFNNKKDDFDPDAAIAQSWQRLMLNDNIQRHDLTLLKHEEYEMQIKKDNPGIDHLKAHEMASSKYNYSKETHEYYDNIAKNKKSQ